MSALSSNLIAQSTELTFPAIVQYSYGEPGDVLRLIDLPKSNLRLGPDDALIRVLKRPIHPGDLHMIRASPKSGVATPIAEGATRGPGFEGVGVVEEIGAAEQAKSRFSVGQRVAFFSGSARAWASHVKVPASALVALPDDISDSVAAQLLINSITAKVALRAGHRALPADVTLPVNIVQSAAGSSVMRLITAFAIELGVRPIRLVRSKAGIAKLLEQHPDVPAIATDQENWKVQVRKVLEKNPVYVAMDAVGGSLVGDLGSLLQNGGTVVNFGWLDDANADLSSFAPRGLSFKGINLGAWFSEFNATEKEEHIRSALTLAQRSPELFEVAAEYPLSEYREAIEHVTRPGKSGTVLLTD